jgi:succinate dehydrogenase / fumarate reductase flavoprotein subunit
MGGGHFDNKKELVEALVMDGPKSIKWLEDLGVMFDKEKDGTMTVKPGGGTSRNRMHSTRDYTGAGICRVLRDEVYTNGKNIKYLEYTSATELIMDDKGQVAGAVLYHIELKEYFIVKAKTVIIATGGFGRLHIRNFETTNHYGATGDGLVLAYRAGANMMFMDSVQYHPTGAVFPEQIVGFLCTEKIRSIGAQPVNKDGELFVYPLEPRDVEASAFIKECEEGRGVTTPSGLKGIWLDSPLIDEISGEGTIEKTLPAMLRQYQRFDIDIRKYPMLVFPTLHYQNGGIEINENAQTSIPGLYVAGEAAGGIHGRNRLMGNSQLDLIVFGRRAGIHAADKILAGKVNLGKLTLKHVDEYAAEVEKLGVNKKKISPIILPDYIPDHIKAKQMTEEYLGTLVK